MEKEIIIDEIIMPNIERKSVYVDSVQMYKGSPLFSWLEINPTELCNRLCTFCPRVEPDEYPNQNLNMSVNLAKKIADELIELNYKGGVVFSGYGEPLLNPEIQTIIKQFGDIYVEVITNGDSLDEEKIAGLFESGLNTIVVSLYDGEFQIDQFHKLFKDAGSELMFEQSLRPFNSNPSTTIPNDQAGFAEFCYGSMISCKEGNQFACARNLARHTN